MAVCAGVESVLAQEQQSSVGHVRSGRVQLLRRDGVEERSERDE